MKKHILLSISLVLFTSMEILAQTPWHTSGDSAMPGSFIGSTNSVDILTNK